MPFYQPDKFCPLCKEESKYTFLNNHNNGGNKFSLFECSSCGGQFWLPFKHPGSDWYEHGDSYNIKDELSPRQIHAYHKNFLKNYGDSIRGLHILDLGCGTGEFMAELDKKGAIVYGTDIDKESVIIAQNLYKLKNIYNLPINDFFISNDLQQLDYITAFEVFEHIDNPRLLLDEAKKLLKSRGKLILSIPTRERPLANLSGWDYPYHHLSRWDEKSIKYLLGLAGYKNITVTYINKFHQLYELFLEILAKKLNFKKASGLKKIARENTSLENNNKSIKKIILKLTYKTGRFIGVVLLPYFIALLFFPVVLLFFPKSGIMYIEASID